ncbi:MAG: exonuclease SbcCD subunit D [Candidatus Tectimicrobiota bacterium]
MARPVTLLHTADVHLGASFPYLGPRGTDHRRQVVETFRQVVEEALARRVDLFLVAGDLFDSTAPSRTSVEFALAALRRLGEAGIPVVVVPGNHDHDGPEAVWRLVPFEEDVPGLRLLLGEGVVERTLPALGLTVVARPTTTTTSPESPLRGVSGAGREGLVVGIAHGSVAGGEGFGTGDFPITPEAIASSGLHYLALGHWHKPADHSRGGVTAWYCGSPEVLHPADVGAGRVLLVTVDEGGTVVEPLAVGRCRAESITLSVEDHPEVASLEAAVRPWANPDLLLDVTLSGLKPLEGAWTAETLEEVEAILAPQFYFLRITDRAQARLDAEALGRHPEVTVAGRFVRLMARRLEEAEGEEERRCVEEALQVGLALLEGREEVLG